MSIKATVKMHLSVDDTVLEAEIRKIVDREVDSYAQRFKTALTHTFKSIMQQAVETWYSSNGLSTGGEVASAIEAESNFTRTTRYQKNIHLIGFFDGGKLAGMSDYYPRAQRWISQYAEYCGTILSTGEYIFSLRWNQGILALPATSQARGLDWVNPCFIQVSPTLKDFCITEIRNNLPSAVAGMTMRSRNQSMGAGIFSRNNSGISNLGHS